jgi:hypothetical protein
MMRAALASIGDWLPPALHFALARKSTEPLGGDTALAKLPSLIVRLHRAFPWLNAGSDRIPTPLRDGSETDPLPIEVATIADTAFAVVVENAGVSTALQRSLALERLHRLARESGAIGTNRVLDAALKQEGR